MNKRKFQDSYESNKKNKVIEQDTSSQLNEIRQLLSNNPEMFPNSNEIVNLIPTIVFIGNQSSGKSSIINRFVFDIIGLNLELNTGNGMVTKNATLINFKFGKENAINIYYTDLRTGEIGSLTHDKFKESMKESCEELSNFQYNINIEGPDCDTFTIIDLPGIITVANDEQDKVIKNYIEDLIKSHITTENCTIIHVISASTDLIHVGSTAFIKQFDIDENRHIIVSTQLDVAHKKQNGVNDSLYQLKNFYPNNKHFIVQPSNENGLITTEQETLNLTSMIVDHEKYNIGIMKLRDSIPSILNTYINNIKNDLFPKLKEYKFHANKKLQTIGYEEKSSRDAIHMWDRTVNTICDVFLIKQRSEINKSADYARDNGSILTPAEDIVQIAKQIFMSEEFQNNRGRQFRGFVSEDSAFQTCISKVKEQLNPHLIKILAKTKIDFNNVIDKMINNIIELSPTCVRATALLKKEWYLIFNQIWEKFEDTIMDRVSTLFNIPETSKRINKKYLYAMDVVKEYGLEKRSDSTENTIKNILQFIKNRINSENTDSEFDSEAKMLSQYVIRFVEEWNQKFPVDLFSNISQMADKMNTQFIGSFITKITSQHDTLVEEPETIKKQRLIYIKMVELLDQII